MNALYDGGTFGFAMKMRDKLTNFVSGLGMAGRDKAASAIWMVEELSDEQASAAYRQDWIARKAIDIPAYDATREWRAWQADKKQIEKIEATEKRLDLVRKTFCAISTARLFGGSAMVLGLDDASPELPINMKRVKKDGLKFIHVVPKGDLDCGEIITDLSDPYYGMPEYFTRKGVAGATRMMEQELRLHPSRVIVFKGNEKPNFNFSNAQMMWGDSVLMAVGEAVQNSGSVQQAMAALVQEAKIDIINIPNLTDIVSTDKGQSDLTARFMYANSMKSIINTLVLDGEETWNRLQVNFAGMPEVLQIYLMITAAAVDIPATRFLSQDPKGLNATGEGDLRNYYDRVRSDQNLRMTPQLVTLDELIVRSSLGTYDEAIFYEWNPLWQMSEGDKADIAKKKAETANLDFTMGLIPNTALAKGRQNQLIEDGFYPGLDKALEEAEANGDRATALAGGSPDDELGANGEGFNGGGPEPTPPEALNDPASGISDV
jgi:phage-related protein (TIGR01555 family)